MTEKTKRGTVYNRIVTNELWEQVNKKNKRMMEDYLTECKQRQKKESTIKQYRNDLRIIMVYILQELDNEEITKINRKEFRNFSIHMKDTWGWSNARANRAFSAMRSMLSYIEDDDDYDYDTNIAKKVKGLPKAPVRTNEDNFFLTFEQVMKLREELIKRGRLQDAVLLMISFDSGGRRNEIHQIQKYGLTTSNQANKVVGKRGKEYRPTYLNDTKELIKLYLDERGEDNVDSLWYKETKDGREPIKYEQLYERVVYMSKILSEIEDKEINFFFHTLRHSRAEVLVTGTDTRMLDKEGKPRKFKLEEVKVLLNHSDISTTESYTKDHSDEVLAEMFGFDN